MKYWEIIADNLSKAEWSLAWVSASDSQGRTVCIADAHRDNGKRFVVHPDEKLTAFVEPEVAIRSKEQAESWANHAYQAIPDAKTRKRLTLQSHAYFPILCLR